MLQKNYNLFFIIFGYENTKNPSIYCQFFLLNEDKNILIAQQTTLVGTTSINSDLLNLMLILISFIY